MDIDIIQIIAIAVNVAILVVVIELIRRSHLKERYSLVWLAASIVLIIFSATRDLLHYIAKALGIYYPPAFLFILAIGFLLVLLLHFSTVISMLSEKNNRLAQELGLLKTRLKNLEKKVDSEAKNVKGE